MLAFPFSAMSTAFDSQLNATLAEIDERGLYKRERIIATPQNAHIATTDGKEVLNFCANNYLGLADHPEIIAAAKHALDEWGFGLASVRFICGTQEIHKELEASLSQFWGWRIPFCILRVSMPTAGCSRRSSGRKTP